MNHLALGIWLGSTFCAAMVFAEPAHNQKEIDDIAERYILAYWQRQVQQGQTLDYPLLMWEDFRGGEVGWIPDDGIIPKLSEGQPSSLGTSFRGGFAIQVGFQVQQILSETQAIVEVRVGSRAPQSYLFKGCDFSKYADGQRFSEEYGAVVTGTYKYTTVLGASRTVFVIERANFPAIPKHPAFIGFGMRMWNDATGKFRVTAAYYKYEDGNVHLVKEDKSVVEVPLTRLCDDDQEYIRKLLADERNRNRRELKTTK